MKPPRHGGYFLCLLLFSGVVPGCDDYVPPPVKSTIQQPLPSPLDNPKYIENVTLGNARINASAIEATATTTPVKRIPLTIRLDSVKVVDKKARWTFRITNDGFRSWQGAVRIFLLSRGDWIDSAEFAPTKPIEASSMVAPGYAFSATIDSSFVPVALHGNVDQYGWAFETTNAPVSKPTQGTINVPVTPP